MRIPAFACGNFYHVYNRGIGKGKIFNEDADRYRFLTSLLHFNDAERKTGYSKLGARWYLPTKGSDPLVRIVAYCLMDNHFHLLVEQIHEHGITAFMKAMGQGYTEFCNTKYQRSGRLFGSSYRAKAVENSAHFTHIGRYIHMNPLDIDQPGWQTRGNIDTERAERFLLWYPWSSYRHYVGSVCDPVVERAAHDPMLGHENNNEAIKEWFAHRKQHPRGLTGG